MDTQSLLNYLKNHGIECWEANGLIKANEYSTFKGNLECECVTLNPDIREIRAWLGY